MKPIKPTKMPEKVQACIRSSQFNAYLHKLTANFNALLLLRITAYIINAAHH